VPPAADISGLKERLVELTEDDVELE